MTNNSVFVKLLKQFTNIDTDFIDTLFSKFKIGDDLEFHLKDSDVAKYLKITIKTLRDRLSNKYSSKKVYLEKADYIKVKNSTTSSITYMINYQCFERLAMSGQTQESETIRNYFVKLREFIIKNQELIYQSMTNNIELKKLTNTECIYFFAVDKNKDNIFKVGSTSNIIQRLRVYNTGRIKDVQLKYLAVVKNSSIIEQCIKLKLKSKQYINNREIYEISPDKLRSIITDCYCKHVTNKENNSMYDELSQLYGFLSYVKDKKIIKPYVIIDN
jgi:hypothetical protein